MQFLRFDTVYGLSELEAVAVLEKHGNLVRVATESDGTPLMLTADYINNRINLELKDGKVVSHFMG